MKAGTRAVGVAESYRDPPTGRGAARSTLAACIVRADRVVDGMAFNDCTVGGIDGTAAVSHLVDNLDREDIQYVLVAGIAPAWFNLLDLNELASTLDRPVLSVSFETSPGLEPALCEAFSGERLTDRLAVYRRQPPREALTINGETVFVRGVGLDAIDAKRVVEAFTPEGGRPEPLRVARLAARAADRWSTDS